MKRAVYDITVEVTQRRRVRVEVDEGDMKDLDTASLLSAAQVIACLRWERGELLHNPVVACKSHDLVQ